MSEGETTGDDISQLDYSLYPRGHPWGSRTEGEDESGLGARQPGASSFPNTTTMTFGPRDQVLSDQLLSTGGIN